ncbi:hypothetical protein SAMN05920897_101156 [Alkalispirochaeta americana]|uniref:Uncharacterized protein n=1 Tax=Alkalispirochaeta americana TaxID=159291 RepID=A0A1N6NAK6_9SPIO|nr:hypothetical protein [Alkalispirochaeta americana]SIP89109.1 hypothetical protein SAMN05920897_101156 [Alkalispirochaeta americana]
MARQNDRHTHLVRIFLVVLLILASSIAMMRAAPGDTKAMAAPWSSFEVILVPEEESLQEVRQRLVDAGKAPLDRYTATVEVEDFFQKSHIPVAELASRFDQGDPRLDPFLRALPELFRGRLDTQEMELIFLPTQRSLQGLVEGEGVAGERARIRGREELLLLLEGLSVEIAGSGRSPSPFAGASAAVAALASLVFVRRRWWPVVLAGVVTVLYGVGSGPVEEAGAVLLFLAWAIWQDHSARREVEWLSYRVPPGKDREFLRVSVSAAVAAGITVAVIVGSHRAAGSRGVLSFLLFFLVLGFLWLLSFFVGVWREDRREHRLFISRQILAGRPPARPVVFRIAAGGALLAVLAVPLLLSLAEGPRAVSSAPASGTGGLVIPVPWQVPKGDQDMSWDEQVLSVGLKRPPGEYPLSIAGYLAHRRYQQSLLYGGDFSVPDLGERIELTRFTREEGRIMDFPETRLVFDLAWLEAQFEPSPQSVYRLFTSEGTRTMIAHRELKLRPVLEARAGWAFLAFLAGGLALVGGMRLPYRSRLGTVGLASRKVE